jgi:hypothetical protein
VPCLREERTVNTPQITRDRPFVPQFASILCFVHYGNDVASSAVSDVGDYVIIRKLLDSILSRLSMFVCFL